MSIEDDLLAETKVLAAKRRTPLGDVVDDALHAALAIEHGAALAIEPSAALAFLDRGLARLPWLRLIDPSAG